MTIQPFAIGLFTKKLIATRIGATRTNNHRHASVSVA